MIDRKIYFLLVISFLFLSGSVLGQIQKNKQTGGSKTNLKAHRSGIAPTPQDVSHGRKPDPETAKIIRQLASDAAGMADADMRKLANGGSTPSPERIKNQPLTTFIPCATVRLLPKEIYEDRKAEFRYSSLTPDPNKLVDSLRPAVTGGCWTVLQPQYITNVTCDADDNTATGVISFDAGLYAGHVHYIANKEKKDWQINEFSFPVRDWRFVRGRDGSWKWFDHFGHIKKDRELPKQKILGQVQFDDKPTQLRRLVFNMKAYPEFSFPAETGRGGAFRLSLPVGKYIVACEGKRISDRYHHPSTSDLIADVEEGQSEMILKISSTPPDRAGGDARNEARANLLVAALQKGLASGERGSYYYRDLENLSNMEVAEGSRAVVTELLKSILESKFKSESEAKSLHSNAIDALFTWATVEDQNDLFCDFLSSRSRRLDGVQDEKVYTVIIQAGSERGIKLVIRRLRQYSYDSNPASRALIKGGPKCEELLIAAAQSSELNQGKSIFVLEEIGSKKCIPYLERLELDCEEPNERNEIHKTRVKILKRLGMTPEN